MSAATLTTVSIPEWGSAVVRCSPETASALHQSGDVRVAPGPTPGEFEIRALHKVGVIRHGQLEIRIRPKVSIGRLLYLTTFAEAPDAWRDVAALLEETTDPLSAVAEALVFHSEVALRPTPLQGYVTHEEAARRVRGRIMFDRQLSRRAGLPLPIELQFDEYELGIPENRVLKAALGAVESITTDKSLGARLRHLRSQLNGVEPWLVGRQLPDFHFGRMNERYRSALALSRVVLEQRSLEHRRGDRMGTAFLFNMNRVFEAYLEVALGRELSRRCGRVEAQHPTHLDLSAQIKMKPDLSWWRRNECLAVIDAKYKRARSEEYPNADAYQMLAYCTRLGLRRGHLVYADLDGGAPGRSVVRNAGIELVASSIDLSGTIDQLETSVRALANDIASGPVESGHAAL